PRRMRLLVVDDEENVRHMLALLLRREGYEVETFEAAEPALGRLADGGVDLVLSDIRMPGEGGLGLVRRVAELPEERRPDVILMSAYGDVETALEGVRLGARDYVGKQPFSREEVLLRVRMCEERARLWRENRALRALAQRRF